MKKTSAFFIATALSFAILCAAEKFEVSEGKLTAPVPEDFIEAPQLPPGDKFMGDPLALFISPDHMETGGIILVHHMPFPEWAADFKAFQDKASGNFKTIFGKSYEKVKQEEIKVGERKGFFLEFKANGDGTGPKSEAEGGDIPHHLRWYFIEDAANKKMVAVLYAGRDSAWKDLNAKFEPSYKALKSL